MQDDEYDLFSSFPDRIFVSLRDDYGGRYWEPVEGLTDPWEAVRLLGDRFIKFEYDGLAPVIWAPFGLDQSMRP